MVAERIAREWGVRIWRRECESLVCTAEVGGMPVAIAKPLTFMNLSGRAVSLLLDRYGLNPQDLVVVLDDLNLPFGRIRVRPGGSSGGQLGLESIVQWTGADAIPRVRLGIGEENTPADKAEFVLSDFPAGHEAILNEMIARAADAVGMLIAEGIEKTMSVFNAQEKEKQL